MLRARRATICTGVGRTKQVFSRVMQDPSRGSGVEGLETPRVESGRVRRCSFFFFFSHTFSFVQLLDKPWSQVSSLLPPRFLPPFFYRA